MATLKNYKDARTAFYYLVGFISSAIEEDEDDVRTDKQKLAAIAQCAQELQQLIDEAQRDEMRKLGYCLAQAGETALTDNWV